MPDDRGLYMLGLHPLATDLDLAVDAPAQCDRSIGITAREVAGTIGPLARSGWVDRETGFGQGVVVQVAGN